MEGNRRSLRGRASDLRPFVPFSFPSRLYFSIRLPSPLRFFFFKINEISAIVKPLAGIPLAHCYHPKNSKLEKDPLDEQKLNLLARNNGNQNTLVLPTPSNDFSSERKGLWERVSCIEQTITNETNIVRDASTIGAHSIAKVPRRLEL